MAKKSKNSVALQYEELIEQGKMPGITRDNLADIIGGDDELGGDGVVNNTDSTNGSAEDNNDNASGVDNTEVVVEAVPEAMEVTPETVQTTTSEMEHKYSVLQGLYNSEVKNLKKQIELRDTQLNILNNIVDKMKDNKQEATPVTNNNTDVEKPKEQATTLTRAKDIDIKSVLTEDEFIEYGQDMIAVMSRIAKAYASDNTPTIDLSSITNELASIKKDIAELKGDIVSTKNEIKDPKIKEYFSELTTLCPEWEMINKSEPFIEWLADEYQDTGVTRQDVINNNHNRMNAKKVAEIFNDYKNSMLSTSHNEVIQPNTKPTSNNELAEDIADKIADVVKSIPPANKVATERPVLDIVTDMISPSSSTSTKVPDKNLQQTGKIYKMSDLKKKERQLRKGEISYNDYEKYMNEVGAAYLDGRFDVNS